MERVDELPLAGRIRGVSPSLLRGSCLGKIQPQPTTTTSGGSALTPIGMLEHARKTLPEPSSVPLERSLESSLRFHVLRQTHQNPVLVPSTFAGSNPLLDHSADVQRLNLHPRKWLVVVGRPLECARENRSVEHHVFFHLNGKKKWSDGIRREESWRFKRGHILTSWFLKSCFHLSLSRLAAIMDPYRSSTLRSLTSPSRARLNASNH